MSAQHFELYKQIDSIIWKELISRNPFGMSIMAIWHKLLILKLLMLKKRKFQNIYLKWKLLILDTTVI